MVNEERIRATLGRRTLAMRQTYGMMWRRRESYEFVSRLVNVLEGGEEGISDMDLRVLVRMYHREIIGARRLAEAAA